MLRVRWLTVSIGLFPYSRRILIRVRLWRGVSAKMVRPRSQAELIVHVWCNVLHMPLHCRMIGGVGTRLNAQVITLWWGEGHDICAPGSMGRYLAEEEFIANNFLILLTMHSKMLRTWLGLRVDVSLFQRKHLTAGRIDACSSSQRLVRNTT